MDLVDHSLAAGLRPKVSMPLPPASMERAAPAGFKNAAAVATVRMQWSFRIG